MVTPTREHTVTPADRTHRHVDDAGPDADDAEEGVSRLALLGHGVYYLLLALLTSQLLTGGTAQEAGPRGAIATVAMQPFGQLLLAGLTIAFIAYALRRWSQLVRKDDMTDRGKALLSGLVWTFLSYLAGRTLLEGLGLVGGTGGGSGGSGQSAAQSLLALPGGQVVLGLIGLGIVAAGLYFGREASDGSLGSELGELGLDGRRAATVLGRVGYAGRSLAYGLVGLFVVRAAANHDPDAGRGLDGALREVQQTSWGTWALLAVAVGLAAFGAFRLLEARYARSPED